MSEADLEVLCNSLDNQNLSSSLIPNQYDEGEQFDPTTDDNKEEEEEEDEESVENKRFTEQDTSEERQDTSQPLPAQPPPVTTDSSKEDSEHSQPADIIFHENIFLQAGDGTYAPYTAHCVLLGNATVLVMLSQVCY